MNDTNTELASPKTATTGLSLFDSGTFEAMVRVSDILAKSSLIPSGLKGKTDEETASNCFRVVEQAQRWGLSPFAVMDHASVVHGRLMWEGKLIHAAITSSLGIRLSFSYKGSEDSRQVTVTGNLDGEDLEVSGTVKDWRTTGNGSPWSNESRHDQMLSYRGAREWARRYAPQVILGVYTPDEFEDKPIRNVTKPQPSTDTTAAALRAVIEGPKDEPEEVKEEPQSKPKRTKKERYSQEVEFVDLSAPKTSNGKTWWTAQVKTEGGNVVELNTFSTSMAERLEGLMMGDTIGITFTQTPKGGFALESFEEGGAK